MNPMVRYSLAIIIVPAWFILTAVILAFTVIFQIFPLAIISTVVEFSGGDSDKWFKKKLLDDYWGELTDRLIAAMKAGAI